MLCKVIDRWTADQFCKEMIQQDQKGKYGIDLEKLKERQEYWKFRTKYLEGRPENYGLFQPFLVIKNFPLAKLEPEHPIEYWDLVEVYSQDIENAPPIFVMFNDYMVAHGVNFPRIINGHHRVAAAIKSNLSIIKIVTDYESWRNLRELCDL